MAKIIPKYEIVLADITTLKADAIVNAANTDLRPRGGVDAAIHKAAGPLLQLEVAKLGGCDVGDARMTRAYRLPGKFVIHTVGPQWDESEPEKCKKLLSDCYRRCIELAIREDIGSIAFPSISTGAFGFPKEYAVDIAVDTIIRYTKKLAILNHFIFCCFSKEDVALYEASFKAYKVHKLMK